MPSITAKGLLGFLRPSNPQAPSPLELELIQKFNHLFPELQGDFFSYLQNAECGCKDRLMEALNRNPDQAEELVRIIYRDVGAQIGRPVPAFAITVEDTTDPATLTSIAGDVLDIEPTRDAYRQTLRQLYADRKVYQGLVLERQSDRWTLYFY